MDELLPCPFCETYGSSRCSCEAYCRKCVIVGYCCGHKYTRIRSHKENSDEYVKGETR